MAARKPKRKKSSRSVLTAKPASTAAAAPSPRKAPQRTGGLVVQPLSLQVAWPHLLLVFVAVLVVYAYTTPRTVALEDDGEFAAVAYFLGVAHPPGYPLFVLLVHLFTWLPVGSIALRAHLASAVFGAATCAVLWWSVRALLPSLSAAYVAALALGMSRAFWSQAIIADVYTLNTLLFFLIFACGLAYLHVQRRLFLRLMALFYGLSLSNHWPLMVLATPCLVCLLWPARRPLLQQLPRELPKLMGLLALGLLPYGWMVWRSQTAPQLSFYGGIDSWQDFWFYVKRSGYSTVDSSPSAGWWDKLQFSGFVLQEMVQQYTAVGALIAALGLVMQWKRWQTALSVGLVAGFVSASLLLVLLLDFDYEFMSRAVFKVYPLIPYGIMALWLALGYDRLTAAMRTWNWRIGNPIAYAIGIVLVGLPLVVHSTLNNRRDYTFAKDYATAMLQSFAPDATVFTHGDADTLVLGYFHNVEGMRPDIQLLNDQGISIALDGRLFHSRRLTKLQKERVIENYIEKSDQPIYFFGGNLPQSVSDINFGFYKKVNKSKTNKPVSTLTINDDLIAYYRRIERLHVRDDWTITIRDNRIAKMSRVLTSVLHLHPQRKLFAKYQPDLETASNHFLGLLTRIRVLERQGGASLDQLLAWTAKAETLADHTISKRDRAFLYLLKGRILTKIGRVDEALEAFNRSLAIYAHPDNTAKKELLKVSIQKAGH